MKKEQQSEWAINLIFDLLGCDNLEAAALIFDSEEKTLGKLDEDLLDKIDYIYEAVKEHIREVTNER